MRSRETRNVEKRRDPVQGERAPHQTAAATKHLQTKVHARPPTTRRRQREDHTHRSQNGKPRQATRRSDALPTTTIPSQYATTGNMATRSNATEEFSSNQVNHSCSWWYQQPERWSLNATSARRTPRPAQAQFLTFCDVLTDLPLHGMITTVTP